MFVHKINFTSNTFSSTIPLYFYFISIRTERNKSICNSLLLYSILFFFQLLAHYCTTVFQVFILGTQSLKFKIVLHSFKKIKIAISKS